MKIKGVDNLGRRVNNAEAPNLNLHVEQKDSKYGWGLESRGGGDLVRERTRNLTMQSLESQNLC